MRVVVCAATLGALCLFHACGGVSKRSSDAEAGDAGQGSGGTSASGGTSRGGISSGGASSGGRAAGGTGASGKGGSSRGGRGGTGPAGGSGGGAGEPSGESGQAGEGTAGAGADPDPCTATDPVVITSEAELIAFAASRCEVLDGSLTINSPTLESLNALAPSTLRAITGTLSILDNPVLADLEGLSGLEVIGRSFVLQSSNVGDIGGLESLRFIGSMSDTDALVFAYNPRLENLEALAGVVRHQTSLVVVGNAMLTSLAGLGRLLSTTNITIANNLALSEIGGLGDLAAAQNVTVASNPALLDVAFSGLARVGSLGITVNEKLVSVRLPVLRTANNLTIAGNQALETVGALDTLVTVEVLTIAGNPRLPQCFVDALDQRLMACNASCGANDATAVCN